MRKNLGKKTYLYPMPVLIIGTYDESGIVNAMNAAWGGISDFNQISIALSLEHKTVKNILKKKAFTVSVATTKTVELADYVGIVSGNKVENKCEKVGMKSEKSTFVDAPILTDFPMCLECSLVSFNEETGILTGTIENVSVDDSVIDENGKVCVDLLKPITYDPVNNTYIELGSKVGDAFKIGKNLIK